MTKYFLRAIIERYVDAICSRYPVLYLCYLLYAVLRHERKGKMKTRKTRRRKRRLFSAFLTLLLLTAGIGQLMRMKVIKLNHPEGIKGADVSSYQGEIDWDILSKEMDFVFIKATEGSKYTDGCFEANFSGAAKCGLTCGAYHFFSFESSGEAQAENFINALDSTGLTDGMLPPVIDVELYGTYRRSPEDARKVIPEIEKMASMLEEHYGVSPIIYCTGTAYSLYHEGFDGCLLWERNVYFHPLHNNWTFWQYSDSEILDGYSGEEKHIDMNMFKGSSDDLENLKVCSAQP